MKDQIIESKIDIEIRFNDEDYVLIFDQGRAYEFTNTRNIKNDGQVKRRISIKVFYEILELAKATIAKEDALALEFPDRLERDNQRMLRENKEYKVNQVESVTSDPAIEYPIGLKTGGKLRSLKARIEKSKSIMLECLNIRPINSIEYDTKRIEASRALKDSYAHHSQEVCRRICDITNKIILRARNECNG